MVRLVFGEGDGEVLDAVRHAELFEEHDEFAESFGEPVCVVGRSNCHEQHHVVGEIVESIRLGEDYERQGECCVFRDKTGTIGVVLILQLLGQCAVIVGEIFLDVDEGCAEARVAYDRKAGRRLRFKGSVGCRGSLAAKDVFYTGEKLVEVVECLLFLEVLLVFWELSSLIFSSRRCFWSRARAVSCTRSS